MHYSLLLHPDFSNEISSAIPSTCSENVCNTLFSPMIVIMIRTSYNVL
jgi:hypothetical protein